ncbi:DUF4179 domain-containing protein [Bacillus alkalisoli]|uniref:DUF4179 domain-containing protein n=1 Tax=Bacillus alkalisoli TaxID=2011008 RepID=UPI000C2457CB|nr:DUF4179 domain-containing protein [Bacillus alkalisoli]
MITETEVQKILAGDKELFIKLIAPYIENAYCITKAFPLNAEKVDEIILITFTNTYNSLSEKKNIVSLVFKEHFRLLSNSIQTNSPLFPNFLETYIFLLSEIQHFSTEEISHIVGITKDEVDSNYQSALMNICGEVLQNIKTTESCIPIDRLLAFSGNNNDETIEDHLEFCPNCREKVKKIKSMKKKYVAAMNERVIEDNFLSKLMNQLPSQTNKKRSWKKQAILASIVVAVFASFIFLLPNLSNWKTAVTNYVKYGEFYNAWGEDTFSVSDAGFTFTVNKVDVSPEYLIVHYSLLDELGEEREVRGNLDRKPQYWGKIIDGEKEHFLGAVNIPYLDKSEKVLVYSLTKVEDIPQAFDLQVAIREIENVIGNWDVTVPVSYAPFKDNREVVLIDETYNVLDIVELKLNELVYTPTGILLDLEMDITDSEVKRLLGEKIENGEDLRESVIRRNLVLQSFISMVDYNGRGLLPVYMTEQGNINSTQKRFTFSPFLADISGINLNFWGFEEASSGVTIEDKINKDSELNIQINEIYYSTQLIKSLEIPLREVEDLALDKTMYGETLETLTVRKLEPNGNHSRGSYEIIVKDAGVDENVFSAYTNWTVTNNEMNRWFHSTNKLDFDPLKNDPGIFLHIELIIEENMPEEIVLTNANITRVIHLKEPIKVPLKNYGF